MIKSTKRITLAILSAVGLLNILLIPFTGGGLFPDNFEPQFFDMMEYFGDAAEDAPTYIFAIQYLLPFFIFLSSIFMIVAALVGKRGLCVGAGITGLGLWAVPFFAFIGDASDMGADFEDILEALFGEHGYVAIGVIIALILFIAYLCTACSAKKEATNPYQQYNPYQQNPYQNGYPQNGYQAPVQNGYVNNAAPYADPNAVPNAAPAAYTEPVAAPAPETYTDITSNATVEPEAAPVEVDAEYKFCPECGTKAKADAAFCGSCGHKF